MQTIENRIQELSAAINLHRDYYYNEDLKGVVKDGNDSYEPISDEEFDALVDELEDLDPDAEAIKQVGAPVHSEWAKVKHTFNAGSLNKVKTPEELGKWIDENFEPSNSIFWSEKIDGLTILLTYEDGILQQAVSRGGGDVGEDLSPNVRKMHGVKLKLNEPFTGVIRGEIFMRKGVFAKHYADAGYANERNAASGISRRYDGTGCEHLDVFCYQAVSDKNLDSEYFQFQYLMTLGLQVPGYGAEATGDRCKLISDIWSGYQNGRRDKLDYSIDGLVIRVNDLAAQTKLGIKHNRPVGAVAFKFKSFAATSIVKNIVCQTGSSGRITPVLEIDPVRIAGAEIRRISIYNFGYIQDMGIDIGATVRIIRSGDVIPVCEAVVKGTGSVFASPLVCSACGGEVGEAGEHLMCLNASCKAQVEGRLSNWVTKLDVKEFGDKLIARLVEGGACKTIPDLYKLQIETLSEIDRMGKKSARKCLKNLWEKNNTNLSLDTFLGSLSIPLIGRTTIRLLINAGFDTLTNILNITEIELISIKGIGSEKAKALLDGLRDNRKMIDELIKLGVEPMQKTTEIKSVFPATLAGKKICITGKTIIKREELAKLIERYGGIFCGNIGKETNTLVVADPSIETIKMKKAKAGGVEIIGEIELMAMMAEI